ncbi:MAG: hypothetical protein ACSW8A_06245 [Lachnospiraceae bacterium]
MFEFKVDDDGFQEWLFGLHYLFAEMVQTMVDIHHLIQANTNQLVPLDTGKLEESFRYDIVRQDYSFIEMHSIYSALGSTGFDYAYYQHDKIATSQHYNTANRKGQMRGEQFYLAKGVRASESLMWTIIEQDYLSLFYGGIK